MVGLPEDEYEERVIRSRLARAEGRWTIEEQTSTLSDIDEKAIQIFRINLVVSSILVSGFSIAVSTENASYATLITPYTKVGAALLFLSIILAAITYTSTSTRIGIAKDAIEDSILNPAYDYDLVEEEIALEYGKMIRYNYEKNASNALTFTLTLLSAVAAICYLTIGLIEIYDSGTIPTSFNTVVVGFFLLFGKLSGVFGTTARWWRLTDPLGRFAAWVERWWTILAKP